MFPFYPSKKESIQVVIKKVRSVCEKDRETESII